MARVRTDCSRWYFANLLRDGELFTITHRRQNEKSSSPPHFFTRTCTRVPSGSVPFANSTTPLRTTPSNSCCPDGRLEERKGEPPALAPPRPVPLSIASLASWSASRLCSRKAWPIENQSNCAISSFARACKSLRTAFLTL